MKKKLRKSKRETTKALLAEWKSLRRKHWNFDYPERYYKIRDKLNSRLGI